MKKTFALVLAVAMVMSLAAVSFAAVSTSTTTSNDKNNKMLSLVGPYKYDGDIDSGKGGVVATTIEYGKAAYYQILYTGTVSGTTYTGAVEDYKDVEKLKAKAKWEMGSDLVSGVSIVKKRVAGVKDNAITAPASGYAYFVEVKIATKETVTDSDIVGTLTFNKKKSDDSAIEFDDADLDITCNVFYEKNWSNDTTGIGLLVTGDRQNLKYDTKYLLKFDYDDEVELSFGNKKGGDNEGTFTVDVSGQGKLVFQYNTTANDAIVAANPTAKLKFISFNNAKFNRTGEFAYEMEDGAFAYQIVDGKLAAIPTCEYDESDETFYFNTRVLGSYVFSDVELVDAAPAVTAPTETPVVNPGTGAAA
ncbi:MAG: hypothetical protein K0S22_2192 [Oscillospiraceae bacterium]|jgi:hypothetical protein|nr:hypothetical protein [Oscillospiraceae bacterium]